MLNGIIERLVRNIDSLNWSIEFQREKEKIQIGKDNIIEADCIKRVIEKMYDNLNNYSTAIKHLKKIKSTSLTKFEIESIRNKHK